MGFIKNLLEEWRTEAEIEEAERRQDIAECNLECRFVVTRTWLGFSVLEERLVPVSKKRARQIMQDESIRRSEFLQEQQSQGSGGSYPDFYL